MIVSARRANSDDVPVLVALYEGLRSEMDGLHTMWRIADGLGEPVADSMISALEDPLTTILIGEIDGFPLGFLLARVQSLLIQANDQRVGSIRLIYVEPDAREVAVGEAMRDMIMEIYRDEGITKFDAHVLPGHRLAKNFFESGGFAARSIIMHHDDNRG